MKDTTVNTSSEVTLFDKNVIATINKLKNQHKRADLASIYKELTTKNLELNNFTEDHLKNRINALLVSGKIIDKPNRDHQSYLLNENTSPITTQTDFAFYHVDKPELLETHSHLFKQPILKFSIRQANRNSHHRTATDIPVYSRKWALFRHYDEKNSSHHHTTFKKEIIIELHKTVEGIFNLELEQFKPKSEKTLSNSHALYQEQIQSLKEVCRTKDIVFQNF